MKHTITVYNHPLKGTYSFVVNNYDHGINQLMFYQSNGLKCRMDKGIVV